MNWVREDGGIVCHKSLEITRSGRWTSATGIEVFRNHLIDKLRVITQFCAHLLKSIISSYRCLGGAFDDKLEALIQFVFNLLSVFEILLWVFLQVFNLFFAVY